jgi:hypothetical protein
LSLSSLSSQSGSLHFKGFGRINRLYRSRVLIHLQPFCRLNRFCRTLILLISQRQTFYLSIYC